MVVKTITSCAFEKTTAYAPASEPQDCLPMMNSKDVLGRLLLLLYMMIPGFPERLALETNIDRLVEAYKLSAALRDSATRISIVSIGEMDLYIATLQQLLLARVVSEEEKHCLYQEFGARA